MPHQLTDKVEEIVLAAFVAFTAFFGKRTLSQYDRRIAKTEAKNEEVLKVLQRIDKEVVKIATKLESLLFCLLFISCSNVVNDPEGVYFKELKVEHDKKTIEGFGVLPARPTYRFKIKTSKNPESLHIKTCHRDEVFRKLKKSFHYEYRPIDGIENEGSCLLQIALFDTNGHHQWAAIDFYGDEKLPAFMACNGRIIFHNGATVCQGRNGSVQRINFREETDVMAVTDCDVPETFDNKEYFITLEESYCLYAFYGHESGDLHRLTTFGYNSVMKVH